MKVKHFMSRRLVTASPASNLSVVWLLILDKRVPSVPIIDTDKKLIGIVTREDILRLLYPKYDEVIANIDTLEELDDFKDKFTKLKKTKVEKIMNKRVVYTRPDTTVMRALSRMIVQKVRQLPVLDDDDKVVGIISKADIFNKLVARGK